MQAITATVTKSTETPSRPHNSDVTARQRTLDRYRNLASTTGAALGAAGAEFTPSAYLMLISRIDNMLQKGTPDRAAVDQLSRLLGEKLTTLSGRARRSVMELPEYQALGMDNLLQLPNLTRRSLSSAAAATPVLTLLKAPAFVAAIRDEFRTQTYGPQGLLRAS